MFEGLQAIRKELKEAKLENPDREEIHDGYQLRFVGKDYAKFITGLPTETVLVPDTEWNNQEQNKNSENIFITGDNLDALKHLENAYSGRIKMIYIDPPYNTGSDGFVYNDKFGFSEEQLKEKLGLTDVEVARIKALEGKCSHSAWLTFMLPRLAIAKRLLSDDGCIFISIDFNEVFNLRCLMNEIFGEQNFQREIVWRIGWLSGYKTTASNYIRNHDSIMFYSKNNNQLDFIKKYIYNNDFKPLVKNSDTNLTNKMKELGLNEKKQKELIDFINHTNRPEKYPLEDTWNCNEYDDLNSIAIVSFSGEKISKMLNIDQDFKGQKSVKMLKRLLETTTKNNDIILDFFAGTSSTAHAVMEMNKEDGGNRKYIMVQLDEPTFEIKNGKKTAKKGSEAAFEAGYESIDQISRDRIKKAAEQLGDTSGFKHYKLAKVENEKILDKIDNFNPDSKNLIADDMLKPFSGKSLNTTLTATGTQTLLTTWLVDDGYALTTPVEEKKFGSYTAFIPEESHRLYLIDTGWNSDATKDLLNKIGKNELIVQSIVVYSHSFDFTSLTELKNNLRAVLSNDIKLIERF